MKKLHPYRRLAIDLYYLEQFLVDLACVHHRPARVDGRKELMDFLNRYAPYPLWEVVYDKYMNPKPNTSELIYYHHEYGLSRSKISRLIKKPHKTVSHYLNEDSLISIQYEPDKVADDAIDIFNPVQAVIDNYIRRGIS